MLKYVFVRIHHYHWPISLGPLAESQRIAHYLFACNFA